MCKKVTASESDSVMFTRLTRFSSRHLKRLEKIINSQKLPSLFYPDFDKLLFEFSFIIYRLNFFCHFLRILSALMTCCNKRVFGDNPKLEKSIAKKWRRTKVGVTLTNCHKGLLEAHAAAAQLFFAIF